MPECEPSKLIVSKPNPPLLVRHSLVVGRPASGAGVRDVTIERIHVSGCGKPIRPGVRKNKANCQCT